MTNKELADAIVGHGVGLKFHEGPQVFHARNNSTLRLQPGMTFTIEPMINAGTKESYIDEADHWTAYTVDSSPSAQWEHTLLVTEDGHEWLTRSIPIEVDEVEALLTGTSTLQAFIDKK